MHLYFVELLKNKVYGIVELVTLAESVQCFMVFLCILHFSPHSIMEAVPSVHRYFQRIM